MPATECLHQRGPFTAEALTAAGPLRRAPRDYETASQLDFAAVQADWNGATDRAMARLSQALDKWTDSLASQAADVVESGDVSRLFRIKLDTGDVAALLAEHMRELAEATALDQQRAAEAQGVKVRKWTLVGRRTRLMDRTAAAMADIMGNNAILSAKRRVLASVGTERSATEVAADVRTHLSSMGDGGRREAVGAALTTAQNVGRRAILEATPPARYFASEILDKNTCKPCRDLDGREFTGLDEAYKSYPSGGYRKCLGMLRCRGMVVANWGREGAQVGSAEPQEPEMETTMPWSIEENGGDCGGEKPWAVVKESDGSVAGCHMSKDEAQSQMDALYAQEKDMAGEAEELGGKPSEGTKKDRRLEENAPGKGKYAPESAEGLSALETRGDAETAPWEGPLTIEGVETGDGREFDAGSLTWADLPLPLRWNRVDSHGGEARTEAVNVGRIDEVWREEGTGLIMGRGVLDLGDEDGRTVHRKIEGKHLRGVSVDVDSIKDADMELVWPDLPDGDGGEGMDMFDMMFAQPEKVVFHKGRIRAATLVDIPAFAEAYIALTDPEGAVLAGGEPVGEAHLIRPRRSAPVLVASAIPDRPPAEWFSDPELSVPTGVTVSDSGRVYGHAALWGTCHIGQEGVCVTPPQESSHPYFMTGETLCSDGSRKASGTVTVGTGHAPLTYGAHAASDHYDNTGAAVADIAVGNDAHGIWIAGALRPGATSDQIRQLRGSGQVSGDWRRIGGQLRLVGLLAVNVPGFPVPKLKTSVRAGSQFALVASGIPHLSDRLDQDAVEQAAMRIVMAMYQRRVHRGGE